MASSPDRPSYEMSSEFIIEELDDALESMIYRWDFCLREKVRKHPKKTAAGESGRWSSQEIR